MELSIIIVNYNTCQITIDCLNSIKKFEIPVEYEIILVDNNSSDSSVDTIERTFPDVILIKSNVNLGFAKGNNLGIIQAKGSYILLLNSDTVLLKDSIIKLLSYVKENNVLVAGPKLLNFDYTLQRSWFNYPSSTKMFMHVIGMTKYFYYIGGYIGGKLKLKVGPAFMISSNEVGTMNVDYLSMACLLIKKVVFTKIGLLDENLSFYHEDCDFGYRINSNGFKSIYYPHAEIVHLGGMSSFKNSEGSYLKYFVGLKYVFKKHKSFGAYCFFKTVIIFGMLIRTVGWFFGLYQEIKKMDLYKAGTAKKKWYNRNIVNTYIRIIKIMFK